MPLTRAQKKHRKELKRKRARKLMQKLGGYRSPQWLRAKMDIADKVKRKQRRAHEAAEKRKEQKS